MSARLVAVPSRSYVEGRDTWNEALFGLLSALLFPSGVIKIVLPNYYNLKLPIRWERFGTQLLRVSAQTQLFSVF